jgi:hypothetical protein
MKFKQARKTILTKNLAEMVYEILIRKVQAKYLLIRVDCCSGHESKEQQLKQSAMENSSIQDIFDHKSQNWHKHHHQ